MDCNHVERTFYDILQRSKKKKKKKCESRRKGVVHWFYPDGNFRGYLPADEKKKNATDK